jgi:hypothetical protein
VRHLGALAADVEPLADAQDRDQPVPQRRLHLAVDHGVVLAVVLAPLRVAHRDVGAARACSAWPGHLTGVGAGVVLGEVLGAVRQPELVAVDQRLHERRSVYGGSTATSTASKSLSLRENASFWTSAMASRWLTFIFQLPAISGVRPCGAMGQALSAGVAGADSAPSASMPGREAPSRNSRLAPPPVEMWPKASSAKPEGAYGRGGVAAAHHAEPVDLRSAPRHARGALGERRDLEDAIGPFQKTVWASASFAANSSRGRRPMSSRAVGRDLVGRHDRDLASADISVAATMSTGSTISTPELSARSGSRARASSWSPSSRLRPTSCPAP